MTRTLEEIATLNEADLRGRYLAVYVIGARPEIPGERAAIMSRARQLGLQIKGVSRG